MPARRLRLLLAALVALLVPPGAAQAAAPLVSAHRGGPLVNGVPVYAENTLPAFAHAAAEGWILEFDVKLTKDGMPVVIHDDTLDRTTTCSGLVSSKTAAQVRACEVDYLGRPGEGHPSAYIADPAARPRVPELWQVLVLAAGAGAVISPEIKNTPPTSAEALGANSFDPTRAYARRVAYALRGGPVPQSRMIVQSFWPPDLIHAQAILPQAQMSLLTLKSFNDGAPVFAAAMRWKWVSPEFSNGLNPEIVPLAHALKRKVVPYTLNTAAQISLAKAQGVDAIITDDPVLADTVLAQAP